MGKVSLPPDKLSDCVAFFRPNRMVLVTTRERDGTVHVAPFAWCMPVSTNPPMVVLALLTRPRKQHTLVNIERDKRFVINFPNHDIAADLVRSSYRYPAGVRKIGNLELEFSPSQCIDVPLVKQCRAHVECRLETSLVTGDHTLLVARVLAASYAPEQYEDGYILNVEKYLPCLHLGHKTSPDGQLHTFVIEAKKGSFFVPYELPRRGPQRAAP